MPAREEQHMTLVIRIVGAELEQSIGTFGYADLFATVEWVAADGSAWFVDRTQTLWMGSTRPQWHFDCAGQRYTRPTSCSSSAQSDRVVIQVMEEHFGGLGEPTCCGSAVVQIPALLGLEDSVGASVRPQMEVPLCVGEELVGTLAVQVKAMPFRRDCAALSSCGASQAPLPAQTRSRSSSWSSSSSHDAGEAVAQQPIGRSLDPSASRSSAPGMKPGEISTGGRHCGSSGGSTASSPPCSDNEVHTPAALVSSAMLRHWSRETDREIAHTPFQAGLVGSKGSRKDIQKELLKSLRVTAKKYPKQGRFFFTYPKERFFVITGPEGSKICDPQLDDLELSWYEDQSAWNDKDARLDFIPFKEVRGVLAEPPRPGSEEHSVVISFMNGSMEVVFSSASEAQLWSSNLNELLRSR